MNRRSIARSVALLALPALLAVSVSTGCGKKEVAPPPPPEVLVAQAVQRDVPVALEVVGQTAGSKDVEIRARIPGYLETVDFQEGAFVKAGDLLYTIDPKEYEAKVAQATANVATNQAHLVQAEQEVGRMKPLAEQKAVSQRDYDNAVSSRDAAKAQVDAARAALDAARLNLGYTRITAPVAGLVDLTRVRPGNLVGKGDSTLLTTISVIDPIYCSGNVGEVDYLRLAARLVAAKGAAKKQPVELVLATGDVYPEKGYVDAVQRAIDPTTGTLSVRLAFANPTRLLRPGQYARLRFIVDVLKGAVCVPGKAVSELQGVQQVVVVGTDGKAEIRTVKTGPRDGDFQTVLEGLKAGEAVVVEGAEKVRPGAVVSPKPAPAPTGTVAAPAAPAES
jgi:membrane fusion protein, multidrug efflux system